jgi:hypothetical protein
VVRINGPITCTGSATDTIVGCGKTYTYAGSIKPSGSAISYLWNQLGGNGANTGSSCDYVFNGKGTYTTDCNVTATFSDGGVISKDFTAATLTVHNAIDDFVYLNAGGSSGYMYLGPGYNCGASANTPGVTLQVSYSVGASDQDGFTCSATADVGILKAMAGWSSTHTDQESWSGGGGYQVPAGNPSNVYWSMYYQLWFWRANGTYNEWDCDGNKTPQTFNWVHQVKDGNGHWKYNLYPAIYATL